MERARARVVKVRESRERERRDKCSSMATQVKTEAGGKLEREREGDRTKGTEGVTVVTVGAARVGQMLWGGFKS